mmetsp:Transcript_19693/g.28982  ORF Transcript_19693/g.28982 Transcript_19693/m.28982 type:complete len:344 (-) Transcript_19693:319-1350(-)|eukprot:CAMPEP_0195510412 /NCGR_PEP_ID=MMETSP0794_2-20130614/3062_1 /TAXON_ID=515487 /ORGANISM="Stephanopyxis turris, Strain CCMP 815" /LENGTH=343 /DNA_ID=CAMNT_0040637829 /DNA_START=45 /DNA_END=1076 /DNA_ORIENTATION=-
MTKYRLHEELPSSKGKHPEAFVDSMYWKPECKNFQMMDWEKWEYLNPTVPKVFDPPQRYKLYKGFRFTCLWWWNRSCYFQVCAPMFRCVKPEMERISDNSQSLIQKLLRPNPDSDKIPKPFRNKLLWTQNNVAPETLVSFNKWAWRSQTRAGRVIGLGNLRYDWTNDTTCFGAVFSLCQKNRYATVQMSPDEKWILLATFHDPSSEGTVNYLHIYIVQEGDEFKTPGGKAIDYVKPGDLVRVSWDGKNPYECDNDKMKYMYFPREVATIDEHKGVIIRNDETYADLLEVATNKPSNLFETCCYTFSCFMSGEDRFDFQVNHISDGQIFKSSPDPPRTEVIERL